LIRPDEPRTGIPGVGYKLGRIQMDGVQGRRTGVLSRFLQSGSFGRQVLTLMSAIGIAQVITIVAAPILGRLYSPEAFGVYAMYTTVLMLSLPLVSGRYELAIVPAEMEDDAFGLVLLCCGIALVLGVITLFMLREERLLALVGLRPIAKYSSLVAASVVLNGFFQALLQFWIRQKQFRRIAISHLFRSAGMTGAQVSMPEIKLSGALGLIIGQIVGIVLSTIFLGRTLQSSLASWKLRHRRDGLRTLRTLAIRYRKHPIYLPWGALVDTLGNKLPVLMLSAFYGPVFLGMYALADRLLRTPSLLVGQSSAQVLFQKMTERHVKAGMPRLLTIWALGMTILCVLPFTLLYFYGRPFFSLVLGQQWAPAGNIAAVLIPTYWGNLVVSPISGLFIIGNRQAFAVGIQALFLVGGVGSLWIGHRLFSNGVQTLCLYSVVQFCVYVTYYAALFVTTKRVAHKQMECDRTCVA
jgi:lipopolysaccharide exporter